MFLAFVYITVFFNLIGGGIHNATVAQIERRSLFQSDLHLSLVDIKYSLNVPSFAVTDIAQRLMDSDS